METIELSNSILDDMKSNINNVSIDLDSARFVSWVYGKGTRYTIVVNPKAIVLF